VAQLFAEVERRTVAQSIVEQVKELIRQDRLTPGQKLPSERELSAQLGVGRSSVREATSAMLALGIIEIRPGEGAFIRPDFPQSMLECVDWSTLIVNQDSSDLFEARIAIETSTARLAALRATPEEQAQLYQVLEQMEQAATLQEFVEFDVAFHLALARASKNLVLRDIIDNIHHLMRRSMYNVLQSEKLRDLSLKQHRSLCEAIGRGSPEEAERIMRTHLEKDLTLFSDPTSGD
jgi:GntR family transcriptional repressor for pyruvate dehydrogenase complex